MTAVKDRMLSAEIVRRMIGAARAMTAMQVGGITDKVGMTMSDTEFGRRVANIVEFGGAQERVALRCLAALMQKYRRQAQHLFSAEEWAEVTAVGAVAIDESERAFIRNTVTVLEGGSDSYLLGWQENATIYNEAKVFKPTKRETERGVAYEVGGGSMQLLLARLGRLKVHIVGDATVLSIIERRVDPRGKGPEEPENAISAWIEGDMLVLRPPAISTVLSLIRVVPNRSYDAATKTWRVPLIHAYNLWQQLAAAGAETSSFAGCGLEQYATEKPAIHVQDLGQRFALVFPYDATLMARIKRIPGAEYVTSNRAWTIPKIELWAFDDALKTHTTQFDRSQVDAALDTVPPPAADLKFKLPATLRSAIPPHDKVRPYQRTGIEFLSQPLEPLRASMGRSLRGFLLADDRGLGKTLEAAISANLVTPKDQQIIVICPASAKHVWANEIAKWIGPAEKIRVLRRLTDELPFDRWIIMSYDFVEAYYDRIKERGIGSLIVDEAHRIKNPLSKRARFIVGHEARDPAHSRDGLVAFVKSRVFLLTGTPIPNALKDSFNYWRAAGHPFGANFRRFGLRFCDPQITEFGTRYDGATDVEGLKKGIAPIFLQRHKHDVAKDLPEKQRQFLHVDVNRSEYQTFLDSYRDRAKDAKFWNSSAKRLEFYTRARMATAFAKVAATIDLVNDILADGEKVIIFSSSTQVLDRFSEHFGDRAVRLDGKTSDKGRERAERDFQTNPDKRVFLGQWEAAGESITLTAATQVVFNELDWVPKTHMQAEDRAHRIGQGEMVNVTYMVAANTLDVEIANLLQKKMGLINTFEDTRDSFFDELATATKARLAAPTRRSAPAAAEQKAAEPAKPAVPARQRRARVKKAPPKAK